MQDDTLLYKDIRDYARTIAGQCIRILQDYQKKFAIVNRKDEIDLATTADIASERCAIRMVRKKYPTHTIRSEESGLLSGSDDFVWYIDPLDGTKEYVRGAIDYNFLIAVEHKKSIVASLTWRNGIQEVYTASYGGGAFLNGEPITVSNTASLGKSFIGFHMPAKSSGKDHVEFQISVLKKLVYASYRVRPSGEDAKQLGLVARGVLDAHCIPAGLKNDWHDVAPGILLVREAGGMVTDWQGNEIHNHDLSGGILASNGKVHTDLSLLLV